MTTDLTCLDGVANLMRHLDGVLDETLRSAIDAHVAGCARCTALVRSYVAVPAIVRDATRTVLTPAGRAALRQALTGRRR